MKKLTSILIVIFFVIFILLLLSIEVPCIFDFCSSSNLYFSSNIKISEIDGQPRVCYNNHTKKIEIFISNLGEYLVDLRVSIKGQINTKNIEFQDLKLEPYSETRILFDYDKKIYGEIVKIDVFPKIKLPDNATVKGRQLEEISEVPFCR